MDRRPRRFTQATPSWHHQCVERGAGSQRRLRSEGDTGLSHKGALAQAEHYEFVRPPDCGIRIRANQVVRGGEHLHRSDEIKRGDLWVTQYADASCAGNRSHGGDGGADMGCPQGRLYDDLGRQGPMVLRRRRAPAPHAVRD
jgi:hypothetical protein